MPALPIAHPMSGKATLTCLTSDAALKMLSADLLIQADPTDDPSR